MKKGPDLRVCRRLVAPQRWLTMEHPRPKHQGGFGRFGYIFDDEMDEMDVVFAGLASRRVAEMYMVYIVDHLELRSPSLPLSIQPSR